MKNNIERRLLFAGLGALSLILFACASAPAQNILQTVNEGAGTDWTAAIWGGPPPAVAVGGNSYETPSSFAVRTPNKNLSGLYPTNFAGSSLQIDAGGILYLKHGGNMVDAVVVNLVLNGGMMTFHGAFAPTPSPMAGTLQVLAASTINSDQSGANAADIWLLWPVSGSGDLTVNMLSPGVNNVILFGTNTSYTGNWSNANGGLIIQGNTTNALGSGTVTLQVADAFLGFRATNNLVIGNPIYGEGSIFKWNTNTVTLSGTNTFTGSLVISNGVVRIASGAAISNAAVISIYNHSALDASPAGGLTLNDAGQVMNCNGTVVSNLTAPSGASLNFHFGAATNDILNVTGSLTLLGNPNLNVTVSGFVPSGSYRLINYSGTIQGGGSFNLVPPAGSAESFGLDTSTPGQVTLTVSGVSQNLKWVGDGFANSWDTASANWTGDATVYADGDNVTFNDSGSAVPDILIAANVIPNSMTVSNTSKQYIFDGSSSSVGVTMAGTLTKLGTNELDFTSSGNNFSGPVNIQAGTLSVGIGGSFGYLGAPTSITNNGVLQVNLAANGETFNAPISGSGSINITGGGASVVLGGTNSYTGLTTIGSGCQLSITTGSALGSSSAGTVVQSGGRLGITSLVGSMTVPEPLVINGAYMPPGGALYANTSGNNITWSGPVTIASDAQIRAVNANVRMNFSNTVLGTNVALECTAGNAAGDSTSVITFSNTVSLGASGSFTADGLAVAVLAGNNNIWGGGTTVASGTLLVNGVLNGGAVAVDNGGTLGGSGTIMGAVTVDGTLAPGNSDTTTLTVGSSVTLNSDATTVMSLNRGSAQNASRLSAATVSYGGVLTVNNLGSALQGGDTFTLFQGTISGAFAATNLPALSSTNLSWNTSQLSSGIIKVASSTLLPPVLTSPSISGLNFSLQVASSMSGFSYVLQGTTTLSPPAWTDIHTNAGTGGTLTFTVPFSSANPQRYYRINVR